MSRNSIIVAILAAMMAAGCGDPAKNRVEVEGRTLFKAGTEAIRIGSPGSGDTYEKLWSAGEYIGVFASGKGHNERYIVKRSAEGSNQAEFYGPLVCGDKISAYYPYEEGYEGVAGALPLEVPGQQAFNPGESLIGQFLRYGGRTYASFDGEERLNFSYPLGMLAVQFQFPEPVTVASLTLSSAELAISGTGVVDENAVLSMPASASRSMTLECAGGVSSAQGEGYTTFIFVLPPAVYEGRSLTLNVSLLGGEPFECAIQDIEIKRIDSSALSVAAAAITGGVGGGFEVTPGYIEGMNVLSNTIPPFTLDNGYFEE